ncbi:helix-turn-helix domain-containing protein, partial [Blautia massiliensis (ex Durand et al. 2017)]|uniref:helix-turn-helix domain-containing protein n=1 Tax=Blautia massiliensis (ex Durand et al. 2017) TaxID=1737424 RepID=UPI002431AA67
MNKVDIKERIKQGLEIREITQTQLAARANIDKGQLSSYISGKYKPRQNNIDALAAALNVNEAWLMGFDVPMERVSNNVETDQLVSKSVECKEILEICEQLSTHNQRKVLTYSKNLLSTQQMEEDLLAAHARTDVEQ